MDDVATIRLHDAGVRKVAILVASLDTCAADALLDHLGPHCAGLVRKAAAYLDDVDAAQRQRVLDEFRRIRPMVPGPAPEGIELDRLPAPRANALAAAPPTPEAPDVLPFEFLRGAEDRELAGLLSGERPATVALVLSQLPAERAGETLACLPAAVQVEVVRRLVELDNTDPETLREVERALESRWARQFAAEQRSAAGPETVARILAACDPQTRGAILDHLAEHDRGLAERFGGRPLAFDEVAGFDDAALAAVYRAADPEVAWASLLGAPPAMVERLLRRLPSEEAKLLRHKLEHPGPIRLSDVEEARRQIAALAQRAARDPSVKIASAA
jgi:flagellar motor switch protein FliG